MGLTERKKGLFAYIDVLGIIKMKIGGNVTSLLRLVVTKHWDLIYNSSAR